MTVSLLNRYQQNGSPEKKLGAVYTSPRVASALVRWAVRSPLDAVLDPSCGEGVFLAAARTRLADLGSRNPVCVGVDVDPQAAAASSAICVDFFQWARAAPPFDVVVGNPPFIRSHLFPEESRTVAFQQMKEMGLHPSRLMSTWAPFLALCCNLLSSDGRLALVAPEELLQVNYAEELRAFLLTRFRRVIVCFPPPDTFPSVQQAVVLLLCDNDSKGPAGLLTMPYARLEEGAPYPVDAAPAWDWCSKWTHLFLSPKERQLVTEAFQQLCWQPFKEYGRVEVGVVTGANTFFILPKAKAEEIERRYLTPIVTAARDLQGIQLSSRDFNDLVEQGRPAFLIHTADPIESLPMSLRQYLTEGVERHINQRFKCRMREPWYAVPSVWATDALLLRQAGEVPKLIHLAKRCTATDTIHRVRWKKPSLGKRHAVGFLNTWTLIACEIMGRSYGGGVLELMPSEANKILLPPPSRELDTLFAPVDERIRQRKFYDAIAIVDEAVTPLFITRAEREAARAALERLIKRRQSRENGND